MTAIPEHLRCPKCGRPLMGDPAYPRQLRPGPTDWCWFHGGVRGRWIKPSDPIEARQQEAMRVLGDTYDERHAI